MPATTQHKLLQHEMPPPEGAWKNIALRLDAEYKIEEIKISDKLQDAALEPPAGSWQYINKILDTKEGQLSGDVKVFPFNWKRLAIAAAIIGVIATAIVFYFQTQGKRNSDEVAVNKVKPSEPEKGSIAQPKTREETITSINPSTANNIPQAPVIVRTKQKAIIPAHSFYPENLQTEDINNEPVLRSLANHTILLADVTEDANITAPVIRDENGKIIMDMSLLTTQSNYITVTGPNGEQTRISSKFANYLAYLNNNNSGEKEEYLDFLIRQSGVWKKRFEEWRNKIIKQGNFAPSCASFFDILELKELIKD